MSGCESIFFFQAEDGIRGLALTGVQTCALPILFFHHSNASWNHTWPEWVEMIGQACDWGNDVTFMGKTYPRSGFLGGVKQKVTVLNKTHPVRIGRASCRERV